MLPRLEFFVQTESHIHSSFGKDKEIHLGEVFVGAQAVLLPGDYAHGIVQHLGAPEWRVPIGVELAAQRPKS